MLTGEKLGAAIRAAIKKKGVTQEEVARHFGVRQSSVSEWCKYGRISKANLPALFDYFKEVVPVSHWGLYPEAHSTPLVAAEPEFAAQALALHQIIDRLAGDERLLAEAASFLNYLASRSQSGEFPPATGTAGH